VLVLKSALLFVLAGLAEISGGYMMWLWLRRHESALFGILGGVVLALYGVIPTFQPAHFGRAYAAYGGVFVVMSLVWGDSVPPYVGEMCASVGPQWAMSQAPFPQVYCLLVSIQGLGSAYTPKASK